MPKTLSEVAKRGRRAVRQVFENVEREVLVREGRKAVRAKARTAARTAKKAAKVGLVVGAVAAALVVRREVSKNRLPA